MMLQFDMPPICTADWMREVVEKSFQNGIIYIRAVVSRGSNKRLFALQYAKWLIQNIPGIRVLTKTKNLKFDEASKIIAVGEPRISNRIENSPYLYRFKYNHDCATRYSLLDIVSHEHTENLRGFRYNLILHDDCEIDDTLQTCICDLREWWTSDPKIILTGKHIILKDGDDYCDRVYSIRSNPYVQLSEPELRELSIVL